MSQRKQRNGKKKVNPSYTIRSNLLDSQSRSIAQVHANCDQLQSLVNIDSTIYSESLLTSLCSNTGLLQSYPQHCTPQSKGDGAFRLAARLRLHYIEMQLRYVGAQSNTLLSGDLFNSVRVTIFKTGDSYQSIPITTLQGLNNGLDMRDVEKVYYDKIVDLPSTAFDSTNGYNVPCVKNHKFEIPLNFDLYCFSTNSVGTGGIFETKRNDIMIEITSDSSVIPHPQISYASRLYFSYM
jgi:hypothetical protein